MFSKELERAARITKKVIKSKNVKIFSQFDADGLTSASILVKALAREGSNFSLSVVKQLTSDVLDSIEPREEDFFIFIDCGSGQLNKLDKILEKCMVLILDHHQPIEKEHLNLLHLNPLIFREEGTSSSVICYLFSKFLNTRNADLVDLAIVGAIGDEQEEKWCFHGMTEKVLKEAQSMGKITVTKGLRLYGRNTRPIHRALAYSFDPYIPGISGSESQAIQFLSEIGIPVKENDEWKKLADLTIEEQEKLATAIIRERLSEEDVADIFGNIYTLIDRPNELQDAREFATLLNACGRTGNPDVGIRLCLGDYTVLERSWDVMENYRRMISNSLNAIHTHGLLSKSDFANFLLAGEIIPDVIIGTVVSILISSNLVDDEKPIFGFASAGSSMVKVSARATRRCRINLRDLIVKAANEVGGEGGGHRYAAGALIPNGKIQEFISHINTLLSESYGQEG